MKITIDLAVSLKDLDGVEMDPEVRLGAQLAIALVNQSQGNVVKYYDWAVDLHKGLTLELDQADFDNLRRFVESNATITILGKRQIIDLMDKSRESAKTAG